MIVTLIREHILQKVYYHSLIHRDGNYWRSNKRRSQLPDVAAAS